MVPYRNLKQNKNMIFNVTEQTTTFPCPVEKLKGRLFDMIGYEWTTEHGNFEITPRTIDWIMKNVKTSMYNNDRSYVYNKAFAVFNDSMLNIPVQKLNVKCSKKPLKMFENIRQWADERGLYDAGDPKTQLIKLQEEMGELAKATLEKDHDEVVDAIGDMVVVLTNLALSLIHI